MTSYTEYDLDVSNLKTESVNNLTELSELRFRPEKKDDIIDLYCQLIFGTMHFEFNSHEYEIGISKARVQLVLEGCETKMGTAFNQEHLPHVEEEFSDERLKKKSGGLNIDSSQEILNAANFTAGAEVQKVTKATRKLAHRYLPVVARPNDSWEIRATGVASGTEQMIVGTAIPNERLCAITGKPGGNRISIIGEVQIAKSGWKISAKRGNKMNKKFNEWQNKDAIVSQILKKALQREASSKRYSTVVAISRSEVIGD